MNFVRYPIQFFKVLGYEVTNGAGTDPDEEYYKIRPVGAKDDTMLLKIIKVYHDGVYLYNVSMDEVVNKMKGQLQCNHVYDTATKVDTVSIEVSTGNSGDLYIVTDSSGCRLRNDKHETMEMLKCHRVLRINEDKKTKDVDGVTFICVYYDGEKTGWVGESLVTKVDSSTEQYTVMYTDLTADEVHVVGTIIGKTGSQGNSGRGECGNDGFFPDMPVRRTD